jgi:hypothetical protein
VRDYGVLPSIKQERQLEPRYRRILTFGDLLDESIGLFRRHWVTFALVSAVWLIPPGLLAVLFSASGALDTSSVLRQVQRGSLSSGTVSSFTNLIAVLVALYVVSALFLVAWAAAVVVVADEFVHSVEPRLGSVIGRTLRSYIATFLAGLLYLCGMAILVVVASLVLAIYVIVPPLGAVAIVAAIAGGLVWWLLPTRRRTWLKWLIVVCAPFGLPAYIGGLWSMYLGAAVLEGHGPIGSLRRSAELVNRHWFRATTILGLAGLIVSVMQYAPSLIVQIPLTISIAARGQVSMGPAELAISAAAGVASQILFASMGAIVYAVLYIDLRNRREGTDIAERLGQLEIVQPAATDG